jgi:hypothetical protein
MLFHSGLLKGCALCTFLLPLPVASQTPLPTAQPPLVVESPRDYQVFQRRTRAAGEIKIHGTVAVPCDAIEARMTGASEFSKVPTRWQRLTYTQFSRTFDGKLLAPAGGFYRVQVRLRAHRKTVGELDIAHVGVGEVFVVAGQSNSTNYGEEKQRPQSGMVVAFSGSNWGPADDPQPGVQDHSTKGSFIPSFGDALFAKYRVPIAVVSVGHGSTSVRQWLPKGERFDVPPTNMKFVKQISPNLWESDGALFAGMMHQIGQLGPGGFRSLLWHQGESDAHQQPGHDISADEYGRRMEFLLQAARKQAGWDFPWFMAQVSYHTPADPSCPPIREAQRRLWQSGLAMEGPDTDQLTGEYRQNGGTHLSAKGLKAHGEMWAERVAVYLDTVLK